MSEVVLAANEVTKVYRTQGGVVRALRGVSLQLRRGRTLAIVGESGCGKSTLARLLVGLETPTSGTVARYSPAIIPMVFQDSLGSLNGRRRVEQLIVEPLLTRDGLWRMTSALKEKSAALAKIVGLSPEHLERYPHELSGGQRQRVNIARALSLDPEILLLDEPVSALDVSIQAQILNLLSQLQADPNRNLSLIFISHDLSVVRHLAHDVIVLYLGEVVEAGPVDQVLFNPRHPYTRALMESEPGNKAGPPERVLLGEPPSPFEEPSGCAFAARCPKVESACRTHKPELKRDVERSVACLVASRALEHAHADTPPLL